MGQSKVAGLSMQIVGASSAEPYGPGQDHTLDRLGD